MAPLRLDFEVLDDGKGYKLLTKIKYHSPRYNKYVTVPVGYISDGASGPATDIVSEAWWVHDLLCDKLKFDDGTPCSNLQASAVLFDILRAEGRWFRARTWFLATWWGVPIRDLWRRLFEITIVMIGAGVTLVCGLIWAIVGPLN